MIHTEEQLRKSLLNSSRDDSTSDFPREGGPLHESLRTNMRKYAQEESEHLHQMNQDERASLVKISLMQDQSDVIAYSRKLTETLKSISRTRKDLSAIVDPEVIKKRNTTLETQMTQLEQQFGYKQNPDQHRDAKFQDLIKQGKDSYGITLSLQYQKAVKNKGSGLPTFANLQNNQKFIPINAIHKIRLSSDIKVGKNQQNFANDNNDGTEKSNKKKAASTLRKQLMDHSLVGMIPASVAKRSKNKKRLQNLTARGSQAEFQTMSAFDHPNQHNNNIKAGLQTSRLPNLRQSATLYHQFQEQQQSQQSAFQKKSVFSRNQIAVGKSVQLPMGSSMRQSYDTKATHQRQQSHLENQSNEHILASTTIQSDRRSTKNLRFLDEMGEQDFLFGGKKNAGVFNTTVRKNENRRDDAANDLHNSISASKFSERSRQIDAAREDQYKCEKSYSSRVQLKNTQMSNRSIGQRSHKSVATTLSGDSDRNLLRKESLLHYEQENEVLKKAQTRKIKRAQRRNSQIKKIAKESRKTLMMYAKQSNVLEQFAQELKETTREDSDNEVIMQQTLSGSQQSSTEYGSRGQHTIDMPISGMNSPRNNHTLHVTSGTSLRLRDKTNSIQGIISPSTSPKRAMDLSPQSPRTNVQGAFNSNKLVSSTQQASNHLSPGQLKNTEQGVFKKRKMSRHEKLQAEGLTVNALKNKYESEFKKRLAVSNAQVKTKKCGGFVEIIKPVKTRNNIPFLIDEKKVKNLNRYLQSCEPEVKVPNAYLHNVLGRPMQASDSYNDRPVTQSIITEVLSTIEDELLSGNETPLLKDTSQNKALVAFGHSKDNAALKRGAANFGQAGANQTPMNSIGQDRMNRYQSIDSIQQVAMDQVIEASEFDGPGAKNFKLKRQDRINNVAQRQNSFDLKAESMVRYSKEKTHKYFDATKQGEKAFIHASNILLEPFSPVKRGQDTKAQKVVRMPPDPMKINTHQKALLSLVEFCKLRNIPFNENEQRYYIKAKQATSKTKFSNVLTAFFDEIKLRHKLPNYKRTEPSIKEQIDELDTAEILSQSHKSTDRDRQRTARESARYLDHQSDSTKKLTSTCHCKGICKSTQSDCTQKSKNIGRPKPIDTSKGNHLQIPNAHSNNAKATLSPNSTTKRKQSTQTHISAQDMNSKINSPKAPFSPALKREIANNSAQITKSVESENRKMPAMSKGSERSILVLDRSFDRSTTQITASRYEEVDLNRSSFMDSELERSLYQAQAAIEEMAKIARCPIDITALKKRRQVIKRVRLSTIAKKNPNFKLSAYQTIHRAKLNERLLQTLERNDVDRPKRIREKYDIFRHFEPQLVNVAEVKRTVREELKKRKQDTFMKHNEARHFYNELLEFIHCRYNPQRSDNPSKAVKVSPLEQKLISDNRILRLPVELERRFLEVLFVIIEDSWELPKGQQWIELMHYLNAFEPESQMFGQDNLLQDCFKFFHKASQLFRFEPEFISEFTKKSIELLEQDPQIIASSIDINQYYQDSQPLKASMQFSSMMHNSQQSNNDYDQLAKNHTAKDNLTLNHHSALSQQFASVSQRAVVSQVMNIQEVQPIQQQTELVQVQSSPRLPQLKLRNYHTIVEDDLEQLKEHQFDKYLKNRGTELSQRLYKATL